MMRATVVAWFFFFFYLGVESGVLDGGIQDMIQVDGEDVQEPFASSRGDGVAGVIYRCPSI